jgi:hypothetical protein
MNEKKKSSSSDDTLMMTDDLLDRLNLEDLIDKELPPGEPTSFYADTEEETPLSPPTVKLSFFSQSVPLEPIVVEGTLQILSFGDEGWRVGVDLVDSALAVTLARRTAGDPVTRVVVTNIVELTGGVDVTVHFGGLDDKCSVVVAADNGGAI